MDDSPPPFRLLIRSDELPTALFRGLLRDLECAYNSVAILEVEPLGRRLRKKEKLRIKEISSPASMEISFSGIPAAFLTLSIAIEFLKKLWDQRQAYWDEENSKWVAGIGKRDFKKLPGEIESDGIRLAATIAADIFSLFDRVERARGIEAFEFQFNGQTFPLK
jgi:hypothetical protein